MKLIICMLVAGAYGQATINMLDNTGGQLTKMSFSNSYLVNIADSSISTTAAIIVDGGTLSADQAEIGSCVLTASSSASVLLKPNSLLSCAAQSTVQADGASAILTNNGHIDIGVSAGLLVNCQLTVTGSVSVSGYATLQSLGGYQKCYEQNIAGSLTVDSYSKLHLLGNVDVQEGGSFAVVGQRKTVYAIATVSVESGGRLEITENTAIVDAVYVHRNECKTVSVTGEILNCTTPTPVSDKIPLPALRKLGAAYQSYNSTDTGIQFEYGMVALGCQFKAQTDSSNYLVMPGVNAASGGSQRVFYEYQDNGQAIFVKGLMNFASSSNQAALSLGSSSSLSIRPDALVYWSSATAVGDGVDLDVDNGATVVVLNPHFSFGSSQNFNDDHVYVCRDSCDST